MVFLHSDIIRQIYTFHCTAIWI